jgi:hypothetical protein
MDKTKTKHGSALIFATIILFSLLAITVTLSAITVSDMKMSQKTKSTTGAFSNADSGVEWALNKIANTDQDTSVTTGFTLDTAGATACPGGFSCNIYLLKADGTVIKSTDGLKFADIKAVRSVGTQGADTQRAIEAAVAQSAGGIGTYQLICYQGVAGAQAPTCCRLNTDTGIVSCKFTPNFATPNNWTYEKSGETW